MEQALLLFSTTNGGITWKKYQTYLWTPPCSPFQSHTLQKTTVKGEIARDRKIMKPVRLQRLMVPTRTYLTQASWEDTGMKAKLLQ